MKTWIWVLAVALPFCGGCGCADRALTATESDAAIITDASWDGDAGQRRDGAGGDVVPPPGCDPQDARSGGAFCDLVLGYGWNGADCVGIYCTCVGADCGRLHDTYDACVTTHADCLAPAECVSQQVHGCPETCMSVAGVWWDGTFCEPIVCCCAGSDCGETYATWREWGGAGVGCDLSPCAATGGYCDYGDARLPTCLDGYGRDLTVPQGTCGLGVCCAPCPDPNDPGVRSKSTDPDVCARIDFACETGWVAFDNECGCGCLEQ